MHFDLDVYRPNQDELSDFQLWLSKLPESSMHFILSGHTDQRASNAYNEQLAENRAKAVEDLIFSSKPKADIITSSYGEEKPLLSSETEEAFAQNRRVEVLVILYFIQSGMWGAGTSIQNPCSSIFFLKRWFSKGCGFLRKKNGKQTVNIMTPNRVYSQEQLQEIFKGKDLNGLAEKIDPNELYMIYNISWRQEYRFINYDYFVKFNKALLDLEIPGEIDASYDAKLVFAKEKLIYPAYLTPTGFLFKNVPEGETARLIIIRYQNEVVRLAEELIVFDKRTFPLNEMKFTEYPEVNAFRDKLRELDI